MKNKNWMVPNDRPYVDGSVEVVAITGAAQGVNHRTETTTNVTSSGGHGAVHYKNFSVNNAVRVKSETTHDRITTFFIVADDGREFPVELRNRNFPVRDGQHVTVLSAILPSESRQDITYINHSTGDELTEPLWYLHMMRPKGGGCLVSIGLLVAAYFLATIVGSAILVVGKMLFGALPISFMVYSSLAVMAVAAYFIIRRYRQTKEANLVPFQAMIRDVNAQLEARKQELSA